MAELEARYPGKIMQASEFTAPWMIRRIPTGILNLDIATNGGYPAGGMTMLVGSPNSGKNTLLFWACAEQQRIYGDDCRIAIIGTELALDKGHARQCGFQVALSEDEIAAEDIKAHKTLKRGLTPEEIDELRTQVGRVVISPPDIAEKSFEMVVKLVESNSYNIVAIDSFGSILPEIDADKSMEDAARVGGAAGLNTQLMRKLNAAYAPDDEGNPNLTCLIGTNQLRDNMKAQAFMKQTKESGGWSIKHGRFVTVELTRTAWLYASKSDKTKIGREMKWDITKQKAGGHDGHEGRFSMLYGPPLHHDRAGMALDLATEVGLIDKKGSHYYMDDIKIGNGRDKAAAFLAEKGMVEELEEEVLRARGIAYLV
jgi:recombination protein RecA